LSRKVFWVKTGNKFPLNPGIIIPVPFSKIPVVEFHLLSKEIPNPPTPPIFVESYHENKPPAAQADDFRVGQFPNISLLNAGSGIYLQGHLLCLLGGSQVGPDNCLALQPHLATLPTGIDYLGILLAAKAAAIAVDSTGTANGLGIGVADTEVVLCSHEVSYTRTQESVKGSLVAHGTVAENVPRATNHALYRVPTAGGTEALRAFFGVRAGKGRPPKKLNVRISLV
jgi:hypothetical protein